MVLTVAFLSFVFSFTVLYITRICLSGDELSTGDTFFHLLISESVRKNQWKYPSSLNNVIFNEGVKTYNYLAYPPLFHYIIALFPTRLHLKVAKIFDLVILSVASTIAAIFAYTLTSSLNIAIFSSFIVIFNLSIFELTVTFAPRTLGLLFYSLVVCIATFYSQSLFSIIAITVLVTLISLTHKFATQMLTFGLLPYCFLFNMPYLLLAFLFGFLLSILISKGFYLKILKEHINWLHFYYIFPPRDRITAKLKAILSRNFWYLAILASIVPLFLQKNESFLYTDLVAKLTFWAFVPLIIALFVSVPALSFLGGEYRYIEYSVVPIGILGSLLIAGSNVYVWLFSLVCVSMSFLALFKLKKYVSRSKALVEPSDILSYRSLRDYSLSNLLVLPLTRTLEVNFFTKLPVIHPVRTRFSSISETLDNLITTYGIQYVLRFKGTDPGKLFATLTNMVSMEKISVFTNFELYKISPKTT